MSRSLIHLRRRTWPKDGKQMVLVPEGEFLYGENKEKLFLPVYWIDKTLVTNAEFQHFVQTTGYLTTAEIIGSGCANLDGRWEDIPGADWRHPAGSEMGDVNCRADHPVVQVSWEDAMAYARWTGKRLPTEQEWEKAARGVDGREYPWGNQQPSDQLCNFNMHHAGTTPVGAYSPQGDSAYGCVDMAGNVWEWTASPGEDGGRVLRGGGWSHPAEYVRLVLRPVHGPEERYDTDGFRCASEA